jgi:integrase
VNELRQAARLSRWLEDRGLAVARLNRERVEEFLAFQRAGGRHRSEWSRPVLWCLLDVLEELGELERGERASIASPTETLLASTEGLLEGDLSGAALAVTGRRRTTLPRGIEPEAARALLRSCDRRTVVGRRDYAVLITLLRLGLRAGEVARLRLDDFDWRAGELVVRGKGARYDRLPLPVEVGGAIAAYLRRGRPRSDRREVFLQARAPFEPIATGTVGSTVRRACRRAGIAEVGPHRLRHTVACEMVKAHVPLVEIAQVLRHKSLQSTAIYARVDLDALRELAAPWPGGAR